MVDKKIKKFNLAAVTESRLAELKAFRCNLLLLISSWRLSKR